MPEYHDTSGRAIARTAGSIVGALLGTALSLVPAFQHTPMFAIVATALVIAYLAARTISQGMLMVVVVGWIAFILGGEAAAFTRVVDTIIGAAIAAVVFFLLPTWHVERLESLFQQWCSVGRAALLAAVAGGSQEPTDTVTRATEHAFTDLYHAQRHFAHAAAAVPLEPRGDEAPWAAADLPLIADALDRVAVALLRVRLEAPDLATVEQMRLVEAYAERFSALGAGRSASVPDPGDGDGALPTLGRELADLERLTQGGTLPDRVA